MLGYVLALFAWALVASCGPLDPCGNDVIAEVASPTGKHRLVVFQRDCGATTGFSTQVSILRRGQAFHSRGNWYASSSQANCFTCDAGGRAAPGLGGGPWVEARWLSPRHVEIRYDELARVFRKESEVAGVSILYTPAPKSTASNA